MGSSSCSTAWLLSVACVGVCVKSADVSSVLACEVLRRRDATMLFFGSWATSVSGFAKIATGLAGAEAG
eukprot:5394553-Pleurochrysis_carterae.AAC.1